MKTFDIGKAMVIISAAVALAPSAAYGATADSTIGGRPFVYHEREPGAASGLNDTPGTAERIGGFGTGRNERASVRVRGSLAASTGAPDVDFYALDLAVGDVIGAAVSGSVDGLALSNPAGGEAVGSRGNLSILYPAASPLPRGEPGRPVLHHVAATAGRYALAVRAGTGSYEVTIMVFRPGPERDRRGTKQTLFLDFDGAVVDTTNFQLFGAVPGVRSLSPLATFLPQWGLSPADEPAVERTIAETVRRILVRDVVANGPNPSAAIRVVTSADGVDPYGQPNVSRVVIGGTVAEAVFSFPTIGVAESIDPGNFQQEETALILLDLLSGPGDPDAPLGAVSLNRYLTSASDRIAFIGRVLGETAAHEAGHLYGNFHTDPLDATICLMDSGLGQNPFGIGPDGIGGTHDDVQATFVPDAYDPNEAFTGVQDTRAVTAFALSRGRR